MGKIWRLVACFMIIIAVHHITTFPRGNEFWAGVLVTVDLLSIILWTTIITFEGKK